MTGKARPNSVGPKKVTVPMLQVLALLLSDPKRSDWFALEISRTTGRGSGTIVQVLFRLEQWGWLESEWESAKQAYPLGRPRRRFYRLTGLGERGAENLLAERFPKQLRWRPA